MSSTIRLALALSNTNSSKFDVILYNVVSFVLFFENAATGLSKKEIRSKIKNEFDLDFGISEIEEAIAHENPKKNYIDISASNQVFSLSDKGIKRFKKGENDELDLSINAFIQENKSLLDEMGAVNKDDIKRSITNALLLIFNADKNELIYLLNNKKPRKSGVVDKLEEKEKAIVQVFFNWESEKKEKLLTLMMKASYDYCILSLKRDGGDFQNGLFNNKEFCLDTNVIFSAVGINGEENRKAVLSFFDLCKRNGIKLCYFNYTKNEISDTLHGIICNFMQDDESSDYLDGETIKSAFAKTRFGNVYTLYKTWLKESGNDGYDDFEKFLNGEIQSILSDLKMVYINEDDVWREEDLIEDIRQKLYSYKESRTNRHLSSMRHDAICYQYLKKQCDALPPTINDQKVFFITFDRLFYEWSVSQVVGRISTIVSVSVIYSLLLKISGRTEDDDKAFARFLSTTLSNPGIGEESYEVKTALLHAVKDIERSDEAKRRIFVIANSMLEKEPTSLSKQEAPSEKANDLLKSAEKTFDELLAEENEEKINEIKTEGEERAKREFERGKEQGVKEERDRRLRAESKRIAKRNKIVRIVLVSLTILLFLGGGIIALWFFYKEGPATPWGWITAVATILGLLPPIPISIVRLFSSKSHSKFLPTNEEVLLEKIRAKQAPDNKVDS